MPKVLIMSDFPSNVKFLFFKNFRVKILAAAGLLLQGHWMMTSAAFFILWMWK